MPELKSFPLILVIFVLVWNFLPVFKGRILLLLTVRLFQCPQLWDVTQIMTRYLHLITNSRSSWNSFVWVHDQAKEELRFWIDKLRSLNGILFWPIPFVPSKVLFTDASLTGRGGFIQGSSLVCHKNWSAEESQKSSTWRDLFAISFALEAFDNHLAGQAVTCNTDNQNVVRIIQAGG